MSEKEYCSEHAQHKCLIQRCEDDIQRLWASIDAMRTWVIVGMASLLVQLGIRLLDALS